MQSISISSSSYGLSGPYAASFSRAVCAFRVRLASIHRALAAAINHPHSTSRPQGEEDVKNIIHIARLIEREKEVGNRLDEFGRTSFGVTVRSHLQLVHELQLERIEIDINTMQKETTVNTQAHTRARGWTSARKHKLMHELVHSMCVCVLMIRSPSVSIATPIATRSNNNEMETRRTNNNNNNRRVSMNGSGPSCHNLA